MLNLQNFKIVSGFVPDYMHCYLEGVAEQFSAYYFNSLKEEEIEDLDMIMKSIAVPEQIARNTRPISCRKDWKAREWENFVIFYSIPILSLVLDKKLFKHWLLFAESLYILLKTDIHIDELNRADEMLHEFVAKSEEYFGSKAMTHNLHQLLHICKSVLDFGPLWAHSTYCFEAGNHYLLQAIQCARGVPQQIVRFVHISHCARVVYEKMYNDASDLVQIFCDEILNIKAKNTYKLSTITYFGKGCRSSDHFFNNLELPETSLIFDKMIKNKCLYETSLKPQRRTNNSIAQIKDNTYIRILRFIVDSDRQEELTVCNKIKTRPAFNRSYEAFRLIDSISEEPEIIPTNTINSICIFMTVAKKRYICSVPNLLHY